MTKNLQTADRIVKLILAFTIEAFYFTNLISGPFAKALMILGALVILIFAARLFIARTLMD